MNQIKFLDFTYEQTQTILKVAKKASDRCKIKMHIGRIDSGFWHNEMSVYNFFREYHLLLNEVNAKFCLYEKTTGGLLSLISKAQIIQAVEFGEESIKELLTEAPTELWIAVDNNQCDNILSFAERTKYPEIFTVYWGEFKEYRPTDVIFENRNKFVEKYFIKKSCGHIYKHRMFFDLIFERVAKENVNIDHNEFYDTGYSIIGVNSHHCDERQQEVWKKYGFQLIDPIYSSGQCTFIYERFYKSISEQNQMQETWKYKNQMKIQRQKKS
jgi:hypothetical protein